MTPDEKVSSADASADSNRDASAGTNQGGGSTPAHSHSGDAAESAQTRYDGQDFQDINTRLAQIRAQTAKK